MRLNKITRIAEYPSRADDEFSQITRRAEHPRRADQSAIIRINLRKSPSNHVGARVVGGGWEGLDGRPRPVPLASILVEHDPIPTHGRPSRQ